MNPSAAHPAEFEWLVKRAHCALTSDFKAIKTQRHGRILGMVGYCNWTPNAVEAHIAVETPIAWRSLIPAVFIYPFVEAGRELIVGVTTSDNERSTTLIKHLGFRETYRLKDGWDKGVDKVIHELRRDECEWVNGKAGN